MPESLTLPVQIPCTHERLDLALRSAFAAGKIIRDSFKRGNDLRIKEPGQLVTETDIRAEELILSFLTQEDSATAIVSEESRCEEQAIPGDCWFVDPIDGTAAFAYGTNPEMPAVMMAYQSDSIVRLAVVFFPLTGEWCIAVKGQGVFDYFGNRVTMRERSAELSNCLVALNPQHLSALESEDFSLIHCKLRLRGACQNIVVPLAHSTLAVRMAFDQSPVSLLIHDNSVESGKQGPWDTAPISLIMEESGGCFLGRDGKPYNMNSPGVIVVARSEQLAQKLLSL